MASAFWGMNGYSHTVLPSDKFPNLLLCTSYYEYAHESLAGICRPKKLRRKWWYQTVNIIIFFSSLAIEVQRREPGLSSPFLLVPLQLRGTNFPYSNSSRLAWKTRPSPPPPLLPFRFLLLLRMSSEEISALQGLTAPWVVLTV